MECDCPEWKDGIKQINGAIILALIHDSEYTAKKFVYCPWCGKELKVIEKTTLVDFPKRSE